MQGTLNEFEDGILENDTHFATAMTRTLNGVAQDGVFVVIEELPELSNESVL